jgi:signal peptidase I
MADETPVEPNPDAIAPGAPPMASTPPDAIKAAEPRAMPSIALDPAVASKAKPASKDADKDTVRELLETIVFVVVLVLMLKTFLAEAFVIPTGSMATTLLGYHYKVNCEQCGHLNLINASPEAEPGREERATIVSCQCENCGWTNNIRNVPQIRPGDPQP